MNKNFLFSSDGEAYLLENYVKKEKSTYVIAEELDTYPNFVRRALHHHGIQVRNRNEAQEKALKNGRHFHPTKGKKHDRDTKEKIAKSVTKFWEKLSPEIRQKRKEAALKRWQERSEEKTREFMREASRGIGRASRTGSKLERFLFLGLKDNGYEVRHRSSASWWSADILLPEIAVVVQVDGPWKHEVIHDPNGPQSESIKDEETNNEMNTRGWTVIRVKCLKKNPTRKEKTNLLNSIIDFVGRETHWDPKVIHMEI